jgi:chemotaxis family two-component system response regulator Rcp1
MIKMRDHYDILLVEDNSAQAQLIEEALEMGQERVHLRTVHDGEKAMELLNEEGLKRPDLIFMDLHLPKKSGKEILQKMRENPHWKNIPVVILTSSNRLEDIYECYALDANCYIQKPLRFGELVDMVNAVEKFWLKRAQNDFVLEPSPR